MAFSVSGSSASGPVVFGEMELETPSVNLTQLKGNVNTARQNAISKRKLLENAKEKAGKIPELERQYQEAKALAMKKEKIYFNTLKAKKREPLPLSQRNQEIKQLEKEIEEATKQMTEWINERKRLLPLIKEGTASELDVKKATDLLYKIQDLQYKMYDKPMKLKKLKNPRFQPIKLTDDCTSNDIIWGKDEKDDTILEGLKPGELLCYRINDRWRGTEYRKGVQIERKTSYPSGWGGDTISYYIHPVKNNGSDLYPKDMGDYVKANDIGRMRSKVEPELMKEVLTYKGIPEEMASALSRTPEYLKKLGDSPEYLEKAFTKQGISLANASELSRVPREELEASVVLPDYLKSIYIKYGIPFDEAQHLITNPAYLEGLPRYKKNEYTPKMKEAEKFLDKIKRALKNVPRGYGGKRTLNKKRKPYKKSRKNLKH